MSSPINHKQLSQQRVAELACLLPPVSLLFEVAAAAVPKYFVRLWKTRTVKAQELLMAPRPALILCVDDYESILIGWKMLLEQEGYKVLTANNWRKALQLFASQPVNEVILDYHMPGMAGDVIASRMKRMKPDVPILLLSGDLPLSEDKLALVEAFLLKTESVADFLAQVALLLTGHRPAHTEIGSSDSTDTTAEKRGPGAGSAQAKAA